MVLSNGAGPERERLAFGTQIIAELRGAPAALIGDAAAARRVVIALLRFLEGGAAVTGPHEAAGRADSGGRADSAVSAEIDEVLGTTTSGEGLTIGGELGESGVVLHAFPKHKRLALRVYSSRTVRPFEAVGEFRNWYPGGKLELHVSGRYRRLGQGERLRRELAGERDYAGLRLDGQTPAAPL